MPGSIRIPAGILLLMSLVPLSATAEDSVRMKNGAVFAGKIVDETETVVLVKTASGTVTLQKSDIKSIKRETEQIRPKTPAPDAPRPGPGVPPDPGASPAAGPAAPAPADGTLPPLRPLFERARAIAEEWSAGVTAIGIEARIEETRQGPATGFIWYFKKRGPAEKGFLYGVLGRTDKPDEMKGNHYSGQVAFLPAHDEIYPYEMADIESKDWIDIDEAVKIARKAAAPDANESRPPQIGTMFLGHRSRPGKNKEAVALCWVVEVDRTLVCLSALTGEVLHVREPEPRGKSK